MISLFKVSKRYGDRVLFSDLSFQVLPKDRIALIGHNGAGKTTLLDIVANKLSPDTGEVISAKSIRTAYLTQEVTQLKGRSILEEVCSGAIEIERVSKLMHQTAHEIERCQDQAQKAALGLQYAAQQSEFEALDGYGLASRAEKVLAGLGFQDKDIRSKTEQLSGGWLMRVALSKLLVSQPDIILLDEPTNHLDLASLIWLEAFLKDYPGGILMISHDRAFINGLVNRIFEIEHGRVVFYTGNYDRYEKTKIETAAITQATFENQQKKIEQTQRFVERFRAKATKAKQVQSRVKQLEKMERIAPIAAESQKVKFSFPQPERCAKSVISLTNVSKSYGTKKVFQNLDLTLERGEKLALVGPNGAGKSTLIKILAGELAIDQGERKLGGQVQIAYYSQHQVETLHPAHSVLEEIRSAAPEGTPSFLRGMLGAFLFKGDDVFKKVSVLSGGEKSRLALAKLLVHPANVILLDEPTNHLDIPSCDVLCEVLQAYTGTLCLITHDRYFMHQVVDTILEIDQGEVIPYSGDYAYYLYKKEQSKADITAEVPAKNSSEKQTNKSERRVAAETRNQNYRIRKPLKQKIEKIEKALESKTAEYEECVALLSDPALYEEKDRFHKIMTRHNQLKKEIDTETDLWETLSLEYEELLSESSSS